MRPAPRFMCPTSEFPICPSGKPTFNPSVRNWANGYFLYKLSIKGVFAWSMADTLGSGAVPHPSKIIKSTFLFIGLNSSSNLRRSEEHTSELQSRENLVCRL